MSRHLPQEDHCDLGLPDSDADQTEKLTAPVDPGAPTPGGSRCNPINQQENEVPTT